MTCDDMTYNIMTNDLMTYDVMAYPVFMRLNIAVHHMPQTRRIWIASWSTACPTTSGINSPFQLEWNGSFYSSQNVMGNIIMEWTLQFWLEWNGYNSSQSKLIQSCIHRIDHFFMSGVEGPISFRLEWCFGFGFICSLLSSDFLWQ